MLVTCKYELFTYWYEIELVEGHGMDPCVKYEDCEIEDRAFGTRRDDAHSTNLVDRRLLHAVRSAHGPHTRDQNQVFWDQLDERLNRISPNVPTHPLPILRRLRYCPLIDLPDMVIENASSDAQEFVSAQVEGARLSFPVSNRLQSEQWRLVRALMYTVSHFPSAVSRSDVSHTETLTEEVMDIIKSIQALNMVEHHERIAVLEGKDDGRITE